MNSRILLIYFSFTCALCCAQNSVYNSTSLSDEIKALQKDLLFQGGSFTDQPTLSIPVRFNQSIKESIKKFNGSIRMGYSYGLNTLFTDTTQGISSIYNISGNTSANLLNIPIQLSFNYSTLRMPLGANNYFRISFDKEGYLKNKSEEITKSINQINEQQDKWEIKRIELTAIQSIIEVKLDMLNRKLSIEDSIETIDSKNYEYDSLNIRNRVEDSLSIDFKSKNDSIRQKEQDLKLAVDSLRVTYDKLLQLNSRYDSIIRNFESTKENLIKKRDDLETYSSNGNPEIDKPQDFIGSIKKIDFGLTYPRTTALSDQTTALRGVGAEFLFNKYYLSFSSGLTINNTLLSNNEITNQLENNQNVFNNFDFQRVKDNGLLSVLKTGIGDPNESHAHIGINYLTNTRFFNLSNAQGAGYDPAASVELDLRYVPKLYQGGVLDLVYGRTTANYLKDSSDRQMVGTLFSDYRSNVFSMKYSQSVSKIRSSFSLQYRLIDPYTNTTVYGMLQPGNRRVAFTSRHRINSSLNFETNYRIDESHGTVNRVSLTTTGVNVTGNIKNKLFYSTMLNYVTYYSREADSIERREDSYLWSASLDFPYKISSYKGRTSFSYNECLFSEFNSVAEYKQLGLRNAFFKNNWSIQLKYNYLFQNSEDLSNGTNIFGISGTNKMKTLELGGGINLLSDEKDGISFGGFVEIKKSISKRFAFSIRGDRFVLGDFYTTYYRNLYEQLPYLLSVNTCFKF